MTCTVIFHMDNGTETVFYVDSEKTAIEMKAVYIRQEIISFTDHVGNIRVVNTAKAHGMTITKN